MNAQIIEVKLEEIENNFDFCLTLVERGHTIKITQEGKPAVLMVPVPEYQRAVDVIETAKEANPQLPMPEGWQPDPAGVKQYVNEELSAMQKELNS
jgi:antitoxin (DNA-binding transcriptional repressor) of toxin-antitoxin stability system|tara:strand:- start:7296 stop:7583 length:288 start_codon:yes stop_codon:yes gene_type:complete